MRILRRSLSSAQAIKIYLITVSVFGIGFMVYSNTSMTEGCGDEMQHKGEMLVEVNDRMDEINLLEPKSKKITKETIIKQELSEESDSESDDVKVFKFKETEYAESVNAEPVNTINNHVNEYIESKESGNIELENINIEAKEIIDVNQTEHENYDENDENDNYEESNDLFKAFRSILLYYDVYIVNSKVVTELIDEETVIKSDRVSTVGDVVNEEEDNIFVDVDVDTESEAQDKENASVISEITYENEDNSIEIQDLINNEDNSIEIQDLIHNEDNSIEIQDLIIEFAAFQLNRSDNVLDPADSPVPLTFSSSDLFNLIESNDIEAFKNALNRLNCNIDQIWDEKGYNLLHRAAAKSSIHLLKAILEITDPSVSLEFINEKTRDANKSTVLHLVIENAGDKDDAIVANVLNFLIQNGAEVDQIAGSESGCTPLLAAITHCNSNAIKALLIHGANVNISHQGLPLLHYSFTYCDKDVVKLLLQNGADPLIINKYNRAALHEAVVLNKSDIVTLLVNEFKCDVNIRTPSPVNLPTKRSSQLKKSVILYGATPLHYAIKKNCMALARELIKMGAHKSPKDSYKKSPSFYDEHHIWGLVTFLN